MIKGGGRKPQQADTRSTDFVHRNQKIPLFVALVGMEPSHLPARPEVGGPPP